MLPRLLVTLPFTGASGGQVALSVGFTPRLKASGGNEGLGRGEPGLSLGEGEAAAVEAGDGLAGEGAVAVWSASLPQLASRTTAEIVHRATRERIFIDVFIKVLANENVHDNGCPTSRTAGE